MAYDEKPLMQINPYENINIGATTPSTISDIEETGYTALTKGPYNTQPRPLDIDAATSDPYSTNMPNGVKQSPQANYLFGEPRSKQVFMNLGIVENNKDNQPLKKYNDDY